MADLLLVRADGGAHIGNGHVLRCLALAQGWQRSGGRAVFAQTESTPSLEERIRDNAMEVVRLDAAPGSTQDSRQTVELALDRGAAWVVADSYSFGADWQKTIKDSGLRLLLLDDYGHAASYSADLILNQNLHATAEMYVRREPYTRLLLGAQYAQLSGAFLEWRGWKRQIPSAAAKVLVTMGGSDQHNITGEVVPVLSSLPDVKAVVVVGGSNPNIEALRSGVAAQSNLQLAVDVPNMPELMAWADMAISAGGSTCLELAFMGLPAVVVPIAANQESAVKALGDSGLVIAVEPEIDGRKERLTSSIHALHSASRESRSAMSAGLRLLVDGRGAERVVRLLHASKVLLRHVSQDDCALIWQWANDPGVRSWSFRSDPIPWDYHVRWFENKCGNPGSIWFLACDQYSRPVGQVRIDLEDGHTGTLNISVAPERRGHGLALSILCAVLDELFAATAVNELHGFVKPENIGSIWSFERAGFKKIGTELVCSHTADHFVFRAEEL